MFLAFMWKVLMTSLFGDKRRNDKLQEMLVRYGGVTQFENHLENF